MTRTYRLSPEGLEAKRRVHKDPTFRARHAAAMADPEVRARHAAAMADPEVRARKSAAMKRAMADPEVRARKSAAMKRAMADPEVRARHAAAMADPEVRARCGWLSKEARAQVVAAIRSGQSYVDIGLDWLIGPGRVSQIAAEEGVQRRPRRKSKMADEASANA